MQSIKAKRPFIDEAKMVSPYIILNSTVTKDRAIVKRKGYKKIVNLPYPHSLFIKDVMLCVSDTTLYLIYNNEPIEICNVITDKEMYYVSIDNKVYMSNGSWTGVYYTDTHELTSWGLPLPPAPKVELVAGNLPAGVYHLCYTYYASNGQLGGSGKVTKVNCPDGYTIRVVNMPDNVICWMTDLDSPFFFKAILNYDSIVSPYPTEPLISQGVVKPPPMKLLTLAFGRIWGAIDNVLHYTEPLVYEWYKPENTIEFEEEITAIIPTGSGMFVCSNRSTWFMFGREPEKFEIRKVSNGALSNHVYMPVVMPNAVVYMPIWLTKDGLVAGAEDGGVFMINDEISGLTYNTKGILAIKPDNTLLLTLRDANLDNDIQKVLKLGRVFLPKPYKQVTNVILTLS